MTYLARPWQRERKENVLPDVDGVLGGQVDVVRLQVLLVVLVVPGLLQGRKLLLNAAWRAAQGSIVGNLVTR